MAAGLAFGLVGIIWLVLPPRYTAIAEVIVDPPRGSSAREPSIAGVLDDAAVQTHVAALRSRSHLQRVFDSIVTELGNGPKEKRSVLGAQAFTFETFMDRINAFKDTRSRMIGVTYTSGDPALAAAIANRSVKLFLATLKERILDDRNDALRSLSKRIPPLRAEVERAEAALQNYRTKHGFTEASRMDMVDQQLVDLNRQLAVARSDLAERHAPPTTLSIRQTTNESHLAEESSTLETRVRQLERRIAVLQDASTEMREPEARLRELQRESTAFAQLYDSLVQRQKEILGEGDIQPDVRVLSSASIPTLPSSLNPLLFVLPAMVLASIGAGLLAILLEQLDGTLRTEQEVTDALGVSCIGVIPQLTRRTYGAVPELANPQRSPKTLLVSSSVPGEGRTLRPHQLIPQDARYTEAVRSVVAAVLQLANPQRSPKTFFVTSSVPREGKTTLAISFAIFAARIQRRVLLIDLSLREPSIARALGGPASGEVLNVLHGRPLAELITAAPGLGFDYLTVSCNPADPVTTVASRRMPKLLRELEGSYDCIVIDGAPLLSATEARLLASMVDKVLFAIKWGSTPQEVAQNALGLLRRSGSGEGDRRDAVAAVITQVNLEKHARYRYGDFSENLLHLKSYPA